MECESQRGLNSGGGIGEVVVRAEASEGRAGIEVEDVAFRGCTNANHYLLARYQLVRKHDVGMERIRKERGFIWPSAFGGVEFKVGVSIAEAINSFTERQEDRMSRVHTCSAWP